jgi:UDP-N-acetylenolpyruvoylglucosamine reductase
VYVLPERVQRDYPLARLTTIRTGGPAELFARPGSLAELERLLAWAAAQGVEVGVVESGSNLLVADVGVRGLVLKLDKELSTIELDGTRIRCGGGARASFALGEAPSSAVKATLAEHANFVENHGEATTADVVAVMAEGRRRVQERLGLALEPEVQVLGPVDVPPEWSER